MIPISLLPLNLLVFLAFLTIGLQLPVLPVYLDEVIAATPAAIGMIVGLQSVATVLTRGYAGSVVDRRGPKRAAVQGLLICLASASLNALMVIFASSSGAAIVLLLCGRVLLGLGESLVLTGAITWGIARVGPTRAGQVMSLNGLAMYAAYAVAGPIGVIVFAQVATPAAGYAAIGLVSMGCCLAGLATAIPLPTPVASKSNPASALSVAKRVWPFGLVLTLQMAGFGTIASFLALVYSQHGWGAAGWAFTCFGAGVVVTRVLAGHLPDRIGGFRVALVSLGIETVGQVLLWQASSPATAVVGALATGIGTALAFPAIGVEALKRASPTERGMVVAVFSAFQDLAFGLTGPVTGFLVGSSNLQMVFGLGALSALGACVLLIGLHRPRTR